MRRLLLHASIFSVLTLLTQVGGIAWLLSLFARRRLIAFVLVYAVLTVVTVQVAPMFGRVPLSCWTGDTLRMHSGLYCVLNRNYVSPELRTVVHDLADHMSRQYPGTVTLALDGSFPFFDGFPLLPHLSHNDGQKLDLAFYYQDETGYLPGQTASPIGYFDFEDGPTSCLDTWKTMRWNLRWLQPLWPDYQLDRLRTKSAVTWLARDARVEKVFLEPHLRDTLQVGFGKVRFQGCFAARHDDHIHFQIY